MNRSTFLSLNWRDAAKGLITAVLTSALTGIYNIISNGGLPTTDQWKIIAIAGTTAGVGYVIKNFLTNSDDQFVKKETK